MKKLLVGLLIIHIASLAFSQQTGYKVHLDLTAVSGDQVRVRINPPVFLSDTATYYMPLIIPGSYSIKDYNRFVKKFKAYDKTGASVKFQKVPSGYKFSKAKSIDRIEYLVSDSWDDKSKANYVFQPGGTNISEDLNYVINHFGFYGYFEGYKMVPYELEVTKPATMYGATSLPRKENAATKDVFYAPNYPTLADNPIMYSVPDTCSFMAGNALVRVNVYSANKVVKSEQICEIIKPLSAALTGFFGEMPVDEYNFIFYFSGYQEKTITKLGGYGALEHNYSSFYFLPEQHNLAQLKDMIMDVGAHEFLHILTPLNVHSEEIQDFDFVVPDMSMHLWMYEGVTEYFSHLVQVRDSLMTEEDFLMEMRTKIIRASKYEDVSFTTMSKEILEKPYKDMYSNVYEKGALIGLLLDIRINELTNSQLNLKKVMMVLAEKYGPTRPFKDEELINEIVTMTHPDLRGFFKKYVEGADPLPFTEYFDKLGLHYAAALADTINSYGMMSFRYMPQTNDIVVTGAQADNNTFGLLSGDKVLKVGGIDLTKENYADVLKEVTEPEYATNVKLTIKRGSEFYEVLGKTIKIPVTQLHYIGEKEDATEGQVQLRNNLLFNN